jgi:uncharacterized membrane protein
LRVKDATLPPVDISGFVMGTVLISLLIPLMITGIMLGIIVWAVRRTVPSGRDAAIRQLRDRFARGEIDQSEFDARMDSLTRRV